MRGQGFDAETFIPSTDGSECAAQMLDFSDVVIKCTSDWTEGQRIHEECSITTAVLACLSNRVVTFSVSRVGSDADGPTREL